MAIIGKTPKKLKSIWPPTTYLERRTVTDKDSWKSLATWYGRINPWDIIYFNFETYDPDEVNWYMYHYLGCRGSKDGKNYSFIADDPIYVYIPSGKWVAPPKKSAADLTKDEQARQSALAVLHATPAANLHFRFGSLELRAGDLPSVAARIIDGRIAVEYHSDGTGNAYYSAGNNRLYLPFTTPAGLDQRGLVVHESVHAAMDIRSISPTIRQAEMLCYMAQALYSLRSGWTTLSTPNFAWQYLWVLAKKIDAGQPLSNDEIQMAYSLLTVLSPIYWGLIHHPPTNDGA